MQTLEDLKKEEHRLRMSKAPKEEVDKVVKQIKEMLESLKK